MSFTKGGGKGFSKGKGPSYYSDDGIHFYQWTPPQFNVPQQQGYTRTRTYQCSTCSGTWENRDQFNTHLEESGHRLETKPSDKRDKGKGKGKGNKSKEDNKPKKKFGALTPRNKKSDNNDDDELLEDEE